MRFYLYIYIYIIYDILCKILGLKGCNQFNFSLSFICIHIYTFPYDSNMYLIHINFDILLFKMLNLTKLIFLFKYSLN